MNYKEIETTQEEVLQSLVDAGIELTPSDTTLGEQIDTLIKYNVYEVRPRLGCYRGMSLVAAKSVEEANRIIKSFVKSDPKNFYDSWGYSQVFEHDLIEGLYSEKEGIIHMGIYYYG